MIIAVLLIFAFIVWLIGLFARAQGAADIAFFAVGIIILLCLLLLIGGRFASTNPTWRIP